MASELQAFESQVTKLCAEIGDSVVQEVKDWFTNRQILGTHGLFKHAAEACLLTRIARDMSGTTITVKEGASAAFYYKLIAHSAAGQLEASKLPAVAAKHVTELFYSTSHPERFQLFNHMSAAEVFFVELDSLLIEVVSNLHVRVDAVQTLHIVFLAEKMLDRFISRGGRFHVIVFDSHATLYDAAPQLALARAVLVERLRATAGERFTFKAFPSWHTTGKHSYAEYHERFQPEFVLVSDAEQLSGVSANEFVADGAAGAGDILPRAAAQKLSRLFHVLLATLVGWRTHVVFTSRLIFKDNDIFGFVVRAQSERFVPLSKCLDFLLAAGSKLVGKASEALDLTETVNAIQALGEKHGLKLASRDYVLLPSIADALQSDDTLRPLVKAHLIACTLMNELPLESRALPRATSDEISKYLNAVAAAAVPYALNIAEYVTPDEKFCDLLDGNLLAQTVRLLNEKPQPLLDSLSPESFAAVTALWSWVSRQAGLKKQPLEPLDIQTVVTSAKSEAVKLGQPMSLSHPVARELVKRYNVENMHYTAAHDVSSLQSMNLRHDKDFAEFDTPAGVKEEEEQLRQFESLPPQQQRRIRKTADGFITAIVKTADSMKVKPFMQPNESLSVLQTAAAPTHAAQRNHNHNQRGHAKGGAQMNAKDRIRQNNRLTLAVSGSQTTLSKFTNVIKSLQRTTKSVSSDLELIDAFVADCAVSRVDDSDSDAETGDRDVAIWAHIVGSSDEASFVLGNTATSAVAKTIATIESACSQLLVAAKENRTTLVDVSDTDVSLRIKSLFFTKFIAHLRGKALIEALRVARRVWTDELTNAKSNDRSPNVEQMIKMFQRLQLALDHIERAKIAMQPADRRELRECATLTGFGPEYERLIDTLDNDYEGRPYQADQAMTVERPNLGAAHTPARFQMSFMGHLLQRPISKTDDDRVPFNPDPWQVDLLNIVDNNGSAVVCAPTSAGKTFISYYCMKKVLRESNDNMVVYVCPTRALINQALADVYGRYGEKRYEFSGYHVFGCLGGAEYVKQPFKCQVLVTLPETFEAIMLSPQRQEWAKRIRYVIFDEIHSIEGSGNGDAWERLLMLVRCPFVALSATIGSTGPVLGWLNGVQQKIAQQTPDPSRDFTVHLVPRAGTKINRWSDIQKYAFLPNDVRPFKSTKEDISGADLLPVHPMSAVTINMLRETFPEDLPFVPSESLHVYDQLVELFKTLIKPLPGTTASYFKEVLKGLKPEKYFADLRFMTQTQARAYEDAIKSTLQLFGRVSNGDFSVIPDDDKQGHPESKKNATVLLNSLLAGYENLVKSAEARIGEAASQSDAKVAHPDTTAFVQQNMLNLLTTLRAKNLFPALVFSFEESDCQQLVEYVVTALEDAETQYRQTKKFRDYEEMMKRKAAEQEAVMERMRIGVARVRERDEDGNVTVRVDEIQTVDEVKDYTIPDILPEFSFRSEFDCLSAAEMDQIAYDLKRGDDLLFRAFQRGIGIHTPALSGKQRVHIERLFRLKYLSVVFATEGLALGVHSPCRSVVLAGDHVHLNTSQFRQMIGRAGRRGLDFLGHAIFLGVAQSKMQRLLTSHLNTLKGHVHIDPIVELRLQQLYDYEPRHGQPEVDAEHVINVVDCLLSRPLFYQGVNSCANYSDLQVRHLGAMLRHFARMGLIHSTTPSSLGCLVTRVMNTYKEAKAGVGALVFAHLVSRRFFHDLADAWSAGGDARVSVFEHVLHTLSYLFTIDKDNGVPLEVHRSILSDPTIFAPTFPDLLPDAPHEVVLPGIKSLARKSFSKHLEDITKHSLTALVDMLAGYADQQKLEPDTALPFAAKKRAAAARALGASPLAQQLDELKLATKVRSPFIAIAGHGDSFVCVEDLLLSLRTGLYLDVAHVPCIDFRDVGSRRGEQILINAAVPDFIETGSQFENGAPRRLYLQKYNGLREDKSWYTLNRFMTVMNNTIRAFHDEDNTEMCMLPKDTSDPVFELLQEVVLQLETRAAEISFKFTTKKTFDEQRTQQQQTQKKAKRPALGKEIRRRR